VAKGSIRIARRYAKALITLYEPSKFESVRAALNEIAKLWEEKPQLQNALQNPGYSLAQRQEVLVSLAHKIFPGDKYFANFLELALEAGRISGISLIAEAYSTMLDELKKLLSLKVTSASKVSENEVQSFKQALEKDFGSLATVEWAEDANLIGGLKVRSGDRLLDGSVRGVLDRLQASLLG